MSVLRAPLGYGCIAATALACLIAQLPSWGSWTWQTRAYLLIMIVASTKAVAVFYRRLPNPARNKQLALAIRSRILRLIENKCTHLRPPDSDTKTACLDIALDISADPGGRAVAYWLTWDGYGGPSRKIEIDKHGTVGRRSDDEIWRNAPLGPLLEDLRAVLHYEYLPCARVDRVRRRGDR